MLTLQTERLDLVACPEQVARAAFGGTRQLETLVGAKIAREWLDDEGRGLLNYYWHMISADPTNLGYGLWMIIHRTDKVMFGTAGFKGKPNSAGIIEIGYGIDKAYRRQGYTFEAAHALVNWGFAQPNVTAVTADCLTTNLGSIRVLEKLGMARTGLVGSYLQWRLEKPERGAV
ncbi:MAG: GNAT family N-acetyltransferase [bacterium]|nr:GNAT family N-acetyltransferase [bacterium]